MTQEPQRTNITEELSKMGNQVAEALRLAWESDERKRLQTEINEGLQQFGVQVDEAMKRASESDAAKRVQKQAQEVVTRARGSEVVDDVREGLLTGLQSINRELTRLLSRLEAEKTRAVEPPREADITSGPVPPQAPARPDETAFPPETPGTI
jgi:hypothetical protein